MVNCTFVFCLIRAGDVTTAVDQALILTAVCCSLLDMETANYKQW